MKNMEEKIKFFSNVLMSFYFITVNFYVMSLFMFVYLFIHYSFIYIVILNSLTYCNN